jgi:hypothetical protein
MAISTACPYCGNYQIEAYYEEEEPGVFIRKGAYECKACRSSKMEPWESKSAATEEELNYNWWMGTDGPTEGKK